MSTEITPAEQAAIDYVADKLDRNATSVQIAKSLEVAEYHYRHVPEANRQQAIVSAAAKAVARELHD